MIEHAKKAAALGGSGLIAFLGYQVSELAKQNYELAQRVAKLEARTEFFHAAPTPEESQEESQK